MTTSSLFESLRKHPWILKLAKAMMAALGVVNAVALGLRLHEGGTTTLQIIILQFAIMAMPIIGFYVLARAQQTITEENNHDFEVGA